MKLQNEEVMLAQLKTLKTMIINELNRFRSLHKNEKFLREKLFVLTSAKSKYFVSYTINLSC